MKKIFLTLLIAAITLPFFGSVVLAAPASAPSPALDNTDLKPSLEIKTDDKTKQITGTLKWSPVKDARYYCVYREDRPSFYACTGMDDGATQLVVTSEQFPNLRATDKFHVRAAGGTRDNSQLLQDTPAATKDVVLAPTEFGTLSGLGDYAKEIMKYALPLGIISAIFMTVYAGILFMTSQGQPDKIKDAQEVVQGAIIGLIVLIMAKALTNFLILPNDLTTDPSNPSIIESVEQQ